MKTQSAVVDSAATRIIARGFGRYRQADRAEQIHPSRSAVLIRSGSENLPFAGSERIMTTISKKLNGFTLAEAMLATVVLVTATAGILLPFTSGASVRAEGARRTLAAGLCADLVEKIANTDFEQIVDTYDGYTEAQGQVKDAQGLVFTDPSYANFSRDVSCQYVYMPQENGTTEPKFVLVTVRVYYNGREIARVVRLFGR